MASRPEFRAAIADGTEPARTRERAAQNPPSGRVCIAQIGAPHGIGGEVRLRAFTEEPSAVASYGSLESEDGSENFAIETLCPMQNFLVARFSGVNDRAAAQRLRNMRLYVPRARLPKLEPETYYYADLIGVRVLATDGRELGTLAAIHDFGAGNILEIAPAGGGARAMLPFTRAVVPEVDTRGGRIVVEPPPGTFVDQSTRCDRARASARRSRTRKRKVRVARKQPRSPRAPRTRDDDVGR
jgi:16S rRNA processing protein RimM